MRMLGKRKIVDAFIKTNGASLLDMIGFLVIVVNILGGIRKETQEKTLV